MKLTPAIENRSIRITSPIIQSLKEMDEKKVKLLLVFNGDKFVSILTIGDIQRAIIKGVNLNEPIASIISTKKKFVSPNESHEKIRQKMLSLRSECMPVVDEDGNLLDVYFWNDFFKHPELQYREKIDLPVVIMAGGKGTRLKPITNVIPKPLVPVGEKTILEEIMDQFEVMGSKRFYMSVNYKSDMMRFYLDQLPHKYQIEFIEEPKPLGTIGSVSLLKGKITTPFFVSNCDIIIDQDYRDVYDYHITNKNDITVVTAIKSFHIPYGVIESGDNGLMRNISEKPDMSYMINTGVYVLSPGLINEIPENTFYHVTSLMDKVRERGGRIGCFPVSEKSWTDIGDWNEYLKLITR